MTYFEDYLFKDGRTLVIDEDGDESDFCEEIRVIKVISDIATKELFVGIKLTRADGMKVYREYPRSAIVNDPITTLADLGLSVAPVREYAVTISEILFDTERDAKREYQHNCLGFKETKKGRVFLLKSVIGASICSTYREHRALRTKGRFSAWREGILKHVGDQVELQLALAIGASAPVAALLKKLSLLDGAAVYALIGASSSGKTTALKMMASIWGKPSVSDGIIDSFVNTEAYFFAQLGQKNGFPHFVDETSAQPNLDLTTMAYNISLGQERGRCKPDGTPRTRKKWAGTVVFTGENSLFQQTNQNRGLYARMIELSIPWTSGAESAEELSRFVARQYGTASIPLVETILSMPDHQLESLFNQAVEEISSQLTPKNGVERRVMKLYALVVLSALIAMEAWEIPFDLKAILNLLEAHHVGNESVRDRESLVYESVKQQVLANWCKFPKAAAEYDSASIWGEQGTYHQWPCVWIAADHFRDFLEAAGEFNLKTALAPLHAKGWVAKFGDRYKKQYKIASTPVDCYCLVLQPTSGLPPIPKSSKITKKNRSFLLGTENEATTGTDDIDSSAP